MPTVAKLIENIVRAKVHLEEARMEHSYMCPVDMDGACNCGASKVNNALLLAKNELEFDEEE